MSKDQPFTLRRSKDGIYNLRCRIRRASNLTPEPIERGLNTRDPVEAWFHARLLLRLLADLGMLAGWNGRKFQRAYSDDTDKIETRTMRKFPPRKKTCTPQPNVLKQDTFPFFDA